MWHEVALTDMVASEYPVNDDVTAVVEIEQRIVKHPGRPDGPAVLQANDPRLRQAPGRGRLRGR